MAMKTPRPTWMLLLLLIVASFLLTGCVSTLLVRDASVEDIIPVFKDYAGTRGYTISYENAATGQYRLNLGSVYVPEVSETTKSKMVVVQPPPKDSNLPTTSYEDTTWRTVSNPGHYVDATAVVSITQQEQDVQIVIDSNGEAGTALNDVRDYIQGAGYKVDAK
jgi:hypothetical protein